MIYITGSLNMDLGIEASRIPESGETIAGTNFMASSGGKGANQAVAVSLLGADVRMCGVVGEDAFGATLLDELQNFGVEVSSVRTESQISTGTAIILISEGNNRIILDKGANAHLTTSDIDRFLADARSGDIYLTQLENPVDVIGYGLKKAKAAGMYTILNPAPADPRIAAYFDFVDLITPNETELALLGGKDALFSAGIRTIVTTLGADGYEIATPTSSQKYPCIRVTAVDTTAAGDTLCGGLAVGLSEGRTLADACAFGSLAASIACTRRGAQSSIPSRREVLAIGEAVAMSLG